MADNRIRLPSGQGGLTRYFDESISKIELSPGAVIILAVAILAIIVLLHAFGGRFFA